MKIIYRLTSCSNHGIHIFYENKFLDCIEHNIHKMERTQ